MQIGAEWIVGVQLLPQARRELMHHRSGVLANPLQYVHEVIVRIDLVQAAGHQQALDDADVFGAQLGPREQPVAAPHRDDPQGALDLVGVDRDVGIVEVNLKTGAPLADI